MLCICFCVAETQLRKLPGLTLSAAGDVCADLHVQLSPITLVFALLHCCHSAGRQLQLPLEPKAIQKICSTTRGIACAELSMSVCTLVVQTRAKKYCSTYLPCRNVSRVPELGSGVIILPECLLQKCSPAQRQEHNCCMAYVYSHFAEPQRTVAFLIQVDLLPLQWHQTLVLICLPQR